MAKRKTKRRSSSKKLTSRYHRKRGGSTVDFERAGRAIERSLKKGKNAFRKSARYIPRLSEPFCTAETALRKGDWNYPKSLLGKKRHSILKRACYEKYPYGKQIDADRYFEGSRPKFGPSKRPAKESWLPNIPVPSLLFGAK